MNQLDEYHKRSDRRRDNDSNAGIMVHDVERVNGARYNGIPIIHASQIIKLVFVCRFLAQVTLCLVAKCYHWLL